jgi:hypothetical protein
VQRAFLLAGGDPEQFWRLTLRDVHLFVEADGARQRYQLDLAYYNAWHSGLFSQSYEKGKFPPFHKNRPSEQKKQRAEAQSWQQQKQFAMTLNAIFGGSFRQRDRSQG